MKKGKLKNYIWAAFGFLMFGLGAVGVVLPILPTTPFLLVAAFCFARSSERLNTWFKNTKLYHRVLENYVKKRTMTIKAKLTILVPVTVLLGIAFALMGRVPVGRVILAVVWIGHIVYFGFVVKTEPENTGKAEAKADALAELPSDIRVQEPNSASEAPLMPTVESED